MTDEVLEDDWIVCSKKAKKPVINKSYVNNNTNINNNNTGRGKSNDHTGRTSGARSLNKSHYSNQGTSNRNAPISVDMNRNYHNRTDNNNNNNYHNNSDGNNKTDHLDNSRVDDTGDSVSSSCMDIDSIRTVDDIDTASPPSYDESYTDMNTSPVNDDNNRREYGADDDDAMTSNTTDSVTTTSAATRYQYVKISLPHDNDDNDDTVVKMLQGNTNDNHHQPQPQHQTDSVDSIDSLDFSVSTHDLSPAASTTSSSTSASSPMDTTATTTTTTTTDHHDHDHHHIAKAPCKKVMCEEEFHALMHYGTTTMTDTPLSNAVYQPR